MVSRNASTSPGAWFFVACALVLWGACGDDAGSGTTTAPPIDLDVQTTTPYTFDCDRIAQTYLSGCPDHLGIDDDTTACALVHDGQVAGPLRQSVARAANVCAQAHAVCDRLFVCVADADGLSALTIDVRVTGTARVEGEAFTFVATDATSASERAWAWLATKAGAVPGDLGVIFTHRGRPWYFKLEDFAEQAATGAYVVDAGHPVKLENGDDNVEIASGIVTITTFSIDGAFDVSASATDSITGEQIELRVEGTFSP